MKWIKERKEKFTWSSIFMLLGLLTIEHSAHRGSLTAQIIWGIFLAFMGTIFLYTAYRFIKALYVAFSSDKKQ